MRREGETTSSQESMMVDEAQVTESGSPLSPAAPGATSSSSSTTTRTFRGIHDSTFPLPPHGWSLACFHHPRRLRPIADMSAEKITVRASPATTLKTKPPPKASAIPVPFVYHPSDDGTDENLLILLHGLGEQSAHPSPSVDSMIFTPQATPRSLSESWDGSSTCPRPLHLHCEHRNSMSFPFA